MARTDAERWMRSVARLEGKMKGALKLCLTMLGEEAIAEARNIGEYTDQTGNLRNSIGYTVIDGTERTERTVGDTAPVSGGSDKAKAKNASQNATDKRIKGGDLELVVVAGMEYASNVEDKGKDVLTKTEKHIRAKAQREIDKTIKKTLDTLGR